MPTEEISGIYLDNRRRHTAWRSYVTDPPVVSVPLEEALLCHFVRDLPGGHNGPFIKTIQHILWVDGISRNYTRRLAEAPRLEQEFRSDNCKAIFCPAMNQLRQASRYIDTSGMEDKLHLVPPGVWNQPDNPHDHTGPFTIMTVSNRFWGRGVPLDIEVFRILRKRYGKAVQMKLVCNNVPKNYPLVEGIEVFRMKRMPNKLRRRLYRESSAFLLLSLHEFSVTLEALAYGVPMISTPAGEKASYGLLGETEFIVEPPFRLLDESWGKKWKTWDEFQGIVKREFEKGALSYMIEEGVAHVEFLMNNPDEVKRMGAAAQAHQRAHHSPESRNVQVRQIYTEILKGLV